MPVEKLWKGTEHSCRDSETHTDRSPWVRDRCLLKTKGFGVEGKPSHFAREMNQTILVFSKIPRFLMKLWSSVLRWTGTFSNSKALFFSELLWTLLEGQMQLWIANVSATQQYLIENCFHSISAISAHHTQTEAMWKMTGFKVLHEYFPVLFHITLGACTGSDSNQLKKNENETKLQT